MGGGGDYSATSARRDWVFLASFHCVFTFSKQHDFQHGYNTQHPQKEQGSGELGDNSHKALIQALQSSWEGELPLPGGMRVTLPIHSTTSVIWKGIHFP